MQLPMDIDRWVNDNNPDEQLQYRKGWWDYIELIRRLMGKFETQEAQVVAIYIMSTPPPQEELLMPVVKFAVGSTEYIVKYDFGVFSGVLDGKHQKCCVHRQTDFGTVRRQAGFARQCDRWFRE